MAVAAGRVAAVGGDLAALAGPDTLGLDARGKVLVPGFLDGHTHLDVFVALPELLREAIPRGLTAFVTEMAQASSALGEGGARWFLDTLAAQPIHAYATAPVISYLSVEDGPGQPALDEAAMTALLEDPRVLGLGEVYWHRLLPEPERLLPLIEPRRRPSARRSRATRPEPAGPGSSPARPPASAPATSRSPRRRRSSGSASACTS